ncbi:MAG: hypothetical protein QGG64_25900 [Candidatus Latescibacteria bacterium]|nr:hypothetical protein [Candidatus Latescibacterota bacterium]
MIFDRIAPKPAYKKEGRSSEILYSLFVSFAVGITLLILSFTLPTIAQAQIQTGRGQLRNAMRGIVLRYNRVEGMFGGYQLKLAPKTWNGGSVWVETGLGLENKKTRWTFGGNLDRPAYAFRLSLFDRTETEDRDINPSFWSCLRTRCSRIFTAGPLVPRNAATSSVVYPPK